jgi:energy-coupling factor transporter ATP-binding protein EcfA2
MTASPVKPVNFLEKTDKSILYLGSQADGGEMWLTDDQVRTHLLVTGSTGSGKTELLVSMAASAMALGSGVTFIDGKSDMSLFAKLHAVATALGREEDVYVLNFMQGQQGAMRTHTINPLASMTVDEICQFVSAFVESTGSGDGDMWRGRAIALVSAIIPVLVWFRDERNEQFSFATLRQAITLQGVLSVLDRAISSELPGNLIEGVRGYLESLPGYSRENGSKQSSTTKDQHGYLSMQFTRMFGLIADHYDHVFGSLTPDIDMRDVVNNRRILIVLLPSLEKSSSEISSIGRVIVGLLKSLMGQSLRSPIEGEWDDVVRKSSSTGKSPYLVVMDEVGHYMTEGMGLMAAQARSLGIGIVFATQEVDKMFSRSSSEASAILANTNTKIFLKAENPGGMHMGSLLRVMTQQEDHVHEIEKSLHDAVTNIHYFNFQYAEPWNARPNIERVSSLKKKRLAQISEQPLPLENRLQMMQPGQMLVAHGGRKAFGTAPYIKIEGSGHRIGLSRFYDTAEFVDHIVEADEDMRDRQSLHERVAAAAKLSRNLTAPRVEGVELHHPVAFATAVLNQVMKPKAAKKPIMFKFPEHY